MFINFIKLIIVSRMTLLWVATILFSILQISRHLKFFFKMFIYFWERETETECEWGRDRDTWRHRIRTRLQALSSQHRAQCRAGTWGSNLCSRSQTLNWLSHPGASRHLKNIIYLFWESTRGRGREEKRESQSGSARTVQLRAWTHEPWDHDLSQNQE